jgi:hypothetical protein
MGEHVIRVKKLKDGVMVQVPPEDLFEHVETVLQRKINLLNWIINNYESMQDDTIKRYIEDLKKSLEDLKLNVKARALIFDEFTWSWLSYLWVISGKTIEEICDRACSIADLNMRLEKGYAEIRKEDSKQSVQGERE